MKINKLQSLFGLMLLQTLAFSCWATDLPKTESVPGGIISISLGEAKEPPVVKFNKRRVMVIQHDNKWHAVIGIPLKTKPQNQTLHVTNYDGRIEKIRFNVNDKKYATQHITIKNKRMVSPNKQDLQRIAEDRKRINKALNTWTENSEITLQFNRPVEGRYSSSFGLRRFFNKQPRKPHSGMDIAAPTGTHIKAPSSGRVIETGNYFFNGNTVFLDHGQGLITMYCHMDSIQVENGQVIQRGDILGTIGMTGRVTGPHLHWSVSLNRTMVNPALFITDTESTPSSNLKPQTTKTVN